MLKLVSDENFDGAILRGLFRRRPDLDIVRVQDVEMSATPDPEILAWAAVEGRILLTHDRVSSDEFVLTQDFLSRMLGVRRAGVSVAANTLKQAGLIDYRRGTIIVRDRKGLENYSCECYGIVRAEYDHYLAV